MEIGNINRLALGTVQFGLPYGITAGHRKVNFEITKSILSYAHESGLEYLDTAAAYGDSEKVLGEANAHCFFKIMTKTMPIRNSVLTNEDLLKIKSAFSLSMEYLNCKKIDCLLVHDAQDLLVQGGEMLWLWMEGLKSQGIVSRLGVSVYDSETVRKLFTLYPIEVIQTPFNLFDQRLKKEGLFDFCSERSIAIHARSIFLQGLLLSHEDNLPSSLADLRSNIVRLKMFSENIGMSVQEIALGFVACHSQIERIVIGVQDLDQIFQLIASWKRLQCLEGLLLNCEEFECKNPLLVDPRLWAH